MSSFGRLLTIVMPNSIEIVGREATSLTHERSKCLAGSLSYCQYDTLLTNSVAAAYSTLKSRPADSVDTF